MSSKRILISPSLIASDLSIMGETVRSFDPAEVDLLHMDVMDGHFVPNMTFGPGYIKNIQSHTSIPLDVHLMIENPEQFVESYLALKPWAVTVHYEATRFPARLCSMIRESGCRAGISINPATPVQALFDIINYTDIVLVMSVDPGFYGQSFMPIALDRISRLKQFLVREGLTDTIIAVDGGINLNNIASVVSAGASLVVAGNAAFRDGNVNENVKELRKAALA